MFFGRHVDQDYGMKATHWLEVRVQLRNHHKLASSARSLEIPRVNLLGHLVSLWLGVLEFAEDGDLWRGDEAKTLRFIASLAELSFDPERFVEALRLDGWVDGWLIHDWLDYAGKYLYAKYKSHNRKKLVEIWTKHGRRYGEGGDGVGMHVGCERDADGPGAGCDSSLPLTLNPIPSTLNPYTLDETKINSPKGGVGGNAAAEPEKQENAGYSGFSFQGSRVKGAVATQAELTGDGVTHKQVYEAFLPLLIFHSILTLEAFFDRVKHSKTTPAQWMMLFLDKIHAVYRDRGGGTTLLDDDDADPVAMTIAGLVPKKGGRRHYPTEAARQLFVEIMIDHDKADKGGKSRWAGRMSAPAITLELNRRKGKAGKNTA
jgi:hypothetical protein